MLIHLSASLRPRPASRRARNLPWLLAFLCANAGAQLPALDIDSLPRPGVPPPEVGPVLPHQVLRWRQEALAYERGDGVPPDPVQAARLYCRAARHGDAQAQFNLAWMLANGRGIERDDVQAAHLFAAAAEQGIPQARNMMARLGPRRGAPPPCLVTPEPEAEVELPQAAPAPALLPPAPARTPWVLPPVPVPANAPEPIVRFVNLVAPEYQLAPHLVLAVIAAESNFDPWAVSPKNAQGLMQLIPDTATRFKVRRITDPGQNIRGGMAYLRWLLAYFEGDLALVLAAYNAGEGAVDRYRGVPPYAETRMYVRRILAAIGGRRSHPFDASVTPPSDALRLIREAGPRR